MGVMDKLKKNSKIKGTDILEDSIFFAEKDVVSTSVPMINAALSGDLDSSFGKKFYFRRAQISVFCCSPPKGYRVGFALGVFTYFVQRL